MKIDIHTHTKKIKQGDSENRNIDISRFSEIIKESDVKILAITNHNHFDLEQYLLFKESVNDVCQVWPGVELDIKEEDRRSHLIVIVNPKHAESFEKKLNEIIKTTPPDSFSINLNSLVVNFSNFDPIYIVHYHSKKPNFDEKDIEKLQSLISRPRRVLKEASNSVSAGIYINHGHNSIYGSDIQDWNDYVRNSIKLPELRLPVESFEQFCLLLEKDDFTIKSILDKKSKESIKIDPFNNPNEIIEIDIYNDINILFGSKGTGKTDILKALSKYYNSKGFNTEVYESNSQKIDEVFKLKSLKIDFNEIDIDNCTEEIASLKSSSEKDVTSLSKYGQYFSEEITNKLSKKLKTDKFLLLDETSNKRNFENTKKILDYVKQFKSLYFFDEKLKSIIGQELFIEFDNVIIKILNRIKEETTSQFIELNSIKYFNKLIDIFVKEIAKKTGQSEKPTKTGFAEYSSNRIKIEIITFKLLKNISKKIPPIIDEVGNLGEKGKLYCKTNLFIQDGTHSDSNYKHVESNNKNPQKSFVTKIKDIYENIYTNSLFENIDELNNIDNSDNILSIFDLLLYYKHFTLNDDFYIPSNGESSMVLLYNELMKEKDIYIIDEPERSLGNDYISEVIVPLLKEKARCKKIIIIATHDANIAVRTLPYSSIYREHELSEYFTYTGNPFTNTLICNSASRSSLDWKTISMKTLEGGRNAFNERGIIYGNA